MPSFFEGLKRIAQGKPVYTAGEDAAQDSTAQSIGQPAVAHKELKVYIDRTETDYDDGNMRTYAEIRNDSDVPVVLDKIRLLGTTKELDTTLKANSRKEVLIYSGTAPKHNKDHDAELQYKDTEGNYFKARHDVRFEPRDEYYVIDKMPYENTSRI